MKTKEKCQNIDECIEFDTCIQSCNKTNNITCEKDCTRFLRLHNVNCTENAKCKDMPGSYECVCNNGFEFKNTTSNVNNHIGENCSDIDECISNKHNCTQ
ncbi:EGF domain-containing protein, partial [Salmonella sp. s51228]|uniref:EGF domain-containing protein n=1 Tax=Salmonella sp. s51228 TaxID=3159652 RepID=UPI0039810CC1